MKKRRPLAQSVLAVWNDYSGGVMSSVACVSSILLGTLWPLQHSANSVLRLQLVLWSEGGFIYLDMSEQPCGVPEVALDMSRYRAKNCSFRSCSSSTSSLQLWGNSPDVSILVVAQWPFPMVLAALRTVFPKLLMDKVANANILQVVEVGQVAISLSWRRGRFPWSRLFSGAWRLPVAFGYSGRRSCCVVVQDIPVVTQRPIPMVLVTLKIPHVLFDKMFMSPLCRSSEFHRRRRGEESRAPTVALVEKLGALRPLRVWALRGAAHHRGDEMRR